MKNHRLLLSGLSALGLLAASLTARAADTSYHFIKEIKVGGEGGWDYLYADAEGRRLYVSHGTKVVVSGLDDDQIVGAIGDTLGVHGIAIANDVGRGFTSNGRENKVSIFDLKTLQTISKVDTGENPDAIVYEPSQHEVYAMNGRSHSASVIDAKSGKVVATVPLSGKPEFAVADPQAGHVYVNLENKSEIAVIDIKSHTVTASWPIAPGEAASGMAGDLVNHRLFLGCDNKLMPMVDSASGKVIATVPIGEGVDANAFDPGTLLAFASCGGAGATIIAHEDSPDKLTVVQTLTTEKGARTMALDTKTHKIYLSNAKKGEANSFKVLVYGP